MPDDVLTPVRAMLARACEFEGQGPRFGVLLQEALPAAEALDSEALGEPAPLLRHVNGRFARAGPRPRDAVPAVRGRAAVAHPQQGVPPRRRPHDHRPLDPEPDRQMII
ncbi:hypothetical protein GWI34_18220 [Actinomadura sp. DSM 109109]|nr:hypothetical protein [Actinomadura lepetitiana]